MDESIRNNLRDLVHLSFFPHGVSPQRLQNDHQDDRNVVHVFCGFLFLYNHAIYSNGDTLDREKTAYHLRNSFCKASRAFAR